MKREDYLEGYRKQLTFINCKIMELVDSIIENSNRETVIILQSDHGPGSTLSWSNPEKVDFNERFSILNAYYLSGNKDIGLYDSITPVNTFRVIFNHYFDANFDLLKDFSFYSGWNDPFRFIDVTNKLKRKDIQPGLVGGGG